MPNDPSIPDELDATVGMDFADMERRIQAGDSWDAEAYLAANPSLAADAGRVVDFLLHEYFFRRRLGQALDAQAWFSRFPRWRELLERRLQTLQTLDGPPETPDHAAQTLEHSTNAVQSSNPPVPELGRHEVYEEIGRGAMGVVYRARDLVLNRPVALKMIVVRHGFLETPQAVQRFYREARAAARLRHPNIIPIHGMGLHQGRHCFTMPLLTGGSLVARIADLRKEARTAVVLAEKIARAVQAAHDQGVIHRDLKPANILLDENGEPHVADFGLAKVLDGEVDASLPGQRVGTPAYMSPEQAAGHTWKVTAASDVWALGVILYELLTGRRPFAGESTEGVYKQVMTEEPPPARKLRPDLPADLERILQNCLRKEAAQRYASAAALADDLARWLRNEQIAPPAVPRRRSAKWLIPVAGLAALLAAAAACAMIALAMGRREPPPATAPTLTPEATDRSEDARALLREYASGRPVQLVGATGGPRWYRWQTENKGANPPYSAARALHLEGFQVALMQLMPADGERRAFRLEAEVWHEQSNKGWVGLYFDCEEREQPMHKAVFTTLACSDMGLNQGCAQVRRQAYRGSSDDQALSRLNLHAAVLDVTLSPANAQTAPWRKLVLQVRQTEVRVSWDGGPEQAILIPSLIKDSNLVLSADRQFDPAPPHPFNPGGGLGLYVEDGNAWFRNVVVQRLPQP